jgi:hypothetical protein
MAQHRLGAGRDDGPAQRPGAVSQRQQGLDHAQAGQHAALLRLDQAVVLQPRRLVGRDPEQMVDTVMRLQRSLDGLQAGRGRQFQHAGRRKARQQRFLLRRAAAHHQHALLRGRPGGAVRHGHRIPDRCKQRRGSCAPRLRRVIAGRASAARFGAGLESPPSSRQRKPRIRARTVPSSAHTSISNLYELPWLPAPPRTTVHIDDAHGPKTCTLSRAYGT